MKGKVTLISTLMVMSTAFTFHAEAAAQNVSPPSWVCEFLDELAAKGIVLKSPAGLFEAEAGFSREKAAVLIAKAAAQIDSFDGGDQKEVRSKMIQQFDGSEYEKMPFLSPDDGFSWKENSVTMAQECIRLESAIEMNRVKEFSLNPSTVVLAKATLEMSRQQQMYSGEEFSWQESAVVLASNLLQVNRTMKNGSMPSFDRSTSVLAKLLVHMASDREHNVVVHSIHNGYVLPKSVSYGNYNTVVINKQDKMIFAKVESELKPELMNLGFFQTQKLMKESQNGEIPQIADKGNHLKVDGELRYSYAKNSAASQYSYNDSKMRLRMYLDYNIDDNWHAYTMLESEKSLAGKFDENGSPTFQRGYVDGNIGLTKLTAGSFGVLMGDGNIFDTQFNGIRMQLLGPVQYSLLYGKSSDYFNNSTILTAHYNSYDYNLDAGIHHLQLTDGNVNTISDVSGTYDFEKFSAGAMYLHSSLSGGNGYVLTLSHGKLKSWESGSSNIWLKYYNQPQGTYVVHTMTGLADYMNGFKGYGLGYSTTLRENLVADFSYYKLEDYLSGNKGNTLWFDLIYTFSNKK